MVRNSSKYSLQMSDNGLIQHSISRLGNDRELNGTQRHWRSSRVSDPVFNCKAIQSIEFQFNKYSWRLEMLCKHGFNKAFINTLLFAIQIDHFVFSFSTSSICFFFSINSQKNVWWAALCGKTAQLQVCSLFFSFSLRKVEKAATNNFEEKN